MTRTEQKIERRNKILYNTKPIRRTFVPIEQFNFIRNNFIDITQHISAIYDFHPDTYKDYNNQVIKLYDYFQSIPELKYLMTRFCMLISSAMIIDSRNVMVNKELVDLWKEDSKNLWYKDEVFNTTNGYPTIFLKMIPNLFETGIYQILDKDIINSFITFLYLIAGCANYRDFQIYADQFFVFKKIRFCGIYMNIKDPIDYEKFRDNDK